MKKTFIFYTDWIDYTKEMSREEKGLFLETILAYQNGEELPNDMQAIKFIWSRVQKQLYEDNNKWSEELNKRKKAGKLGGLAKASKDKQVLASASSEKQILTDNENVNVNENDNEKDNETKENITSVTANAELSQEKEYGKKEINEVQELIKQECISLGIIYKSGTYERQRINNILTGIEYGELCDRMKMTRIDFALNIMRVSTKLSFWNGKIYNAETIYKYYAQVYNEAKKQKEELQKKEMIDYGTI